MYSHIPNKFQNYFPKSEKNIPISICSLLSAVVPKLLGCGPLLLLNIFHGAPGCLTYTKAHIVPRSLQ